jgi:hypothetical protein
VNVGSQLQGWSKRVRHGSKRFVRRVIYLLAAFVLAEGLFSDAGLNAFSLRTTSGWFHVVLLAVTLLGLVVGIWPSNRSGSLAHRLEGVLPWLTTIMLVALNTATITEWMSRLSLESVSDLAFRFMETLAWPLVVLVAIVLFRDALISLLARIKEASGFWGSVGFESAATDLREDALAVELDSRTTGESTARARLGEGETSQNASLVDKKAGDGRSDAREESEPDRTEADAFRTKNTLPGVGAGADPLTQSQGASVDASNAPHLSGPEQPQSWISPDRAQWSRSVRRQQTEISRSRSSGPIGGGDARNSRHQLVGQFVDSWSILESEALDALVYLLEHDLTDAGSKKHLGSPVRQVFMELARIGLVDREAANIAQSAQRLRNEILHRGPETQSALTIDGLIGTTQSLTRTLQEALGVLLELSEPSP